MTDEHIEQQTEVQQDDQKASESFAAGFNRVRSGEEEPQQTPTEEQHQEDGEEGKEEPEIAELAKDEREEVKPREEPKPALDPAVDQRLRKIEGTLGGWTQKLDQVLSGARQPAEPGEPQRKETREGLKAKLDALKEDLDPLRNDYPEFVKPLDALAATVEEALSVDPGEQQPDMSRLLADVEATVEARIEAERQRQQTLKQMDRVEAKHEGWGNIVQSEPFENWAFDGGPSKEEREAYFAQPIDSPERHDTRLAFATRYPKWWGDRGARYFSTDSTEAISLLDDYKAKEAPKDPSTEQEEKRQRQEKRLRSAQTPRGSGAPVNHEPSPEQAFARGFNKVHKAAYGR